MTDFQLLARQSGSPSSRSPDRHRAAHPIAIQPLTRAGRPARPLTRAGPPVHFFLSFFLVWPGAGGAVATWGTVAASAATPASASTAGGSRLVASVGGWDA